MATTFSSPSNRIPFGSSVTSSPVYSPLSFGFGNGFNSPNSLTPTKINSNSLSNNSVKCLKSSKKREFIEEDDIKMSITDEDIENKPIRSIKKVKSSIINNNNNNNSGGNGNSSSLDEPDLGVLLASLPHQSLLSIMENVLNQEPSIKSLVLSKIPQPTLQTYLDCLNDSTVKLINSIPLGQSRTDYTLSRLKIPLTDWSKIISTYLPYFTTDKSHPIDTFMAIQPTTLQLIKIIDRLPNLNNETVPKSLLLVWKKLENEWSKWLKDVDDFVNSKGGMFGSSVVESWAKGLDEICQFINVVPQEQSFCLDCQIQLINLRQNWEIRLGWLIGRKISERPEWA